MSSSTSLRRLITAFVAVLLTFTAFAPCSFGPEHALQPLSHAALKAASSPAAFAAQERGRQTQFGIVAAIAGEFVGSGSADPGRCSLPVCRDQPPASVLLSRRNGTRGPPLD